MPILNVCHTTTYRYGKLVGFGEHRMMFRPRDSADQRLIEATLEITPEPSDLRWMHDVQGNCVGIAHFAARATMLRFISCLRVDHDGGDPAPLESRIAEHAQVMPFAYDLGEAPDLLRSIERQFPDPGHTVAAWARSFFRLGAATRTADLLHAITQAVRRRFTYVARHEPGLQEPATTLRLGTGACRDFAVLVMEALRSLGLATRFVTGYLHVRDASLDLRGGGSTHAWLQVYLPGAGWVELDPTNDIVGSRDLVRVAVTRDPAHAVPLAGVWMGFPSDCLGMEVSVRVTADTAGEPLARRLA